MFDTSYEEYPEIKEVTKITDMILMQILNSREAVIKSGGPYGEALNDNSYFEDDLTCWRVFDVSGLNNDISRVILFDELDDGSYSMHFKDNQIKPEHIYYEN